MSVIHQNYLILITIISDKNFKKADELNTIIKSYNLSHWYFELES